jgi:hypothetical protein
MFPYKLGFMSTPVATKSFTQYTKKFFGVALFSLGWGVGGVAVYVMPIGVYVPFPTARTLWLKGGGYPVLVPRNMLVPRNTMRFMHKVMRFVHGLRYGLGLILLGYGPTYPMPCACVGFVWVCWVLCVGVCPGCYPLAWCMVVNANDSHVDSFVLHALGLLCWCVGGCIPVCFFVCLFGHVRAWFPHVFPYVSPYPMPYLIPYSESIRTWAKGLSFLFGL